MKRPHVIVPTAIYTLATAAEALGLPSSCLPREVRLGRLRVTKRSGRYFVLGSWLLAWLRGGEVRRQRAREATTAQSANGHTEAE
jgi:hypothetical protein